jgi:hypothetical protein
MKRPWSGRQVSVKESWHLQETGRLVCSVPARAYEPWGCKRTPCGVTTNDVGMQGARHALSCLKSPVSCNLHRHGRSGEVGSADQSPDADLHR